jgi:hypothetical protein
VGGNVEPRGGERIDAELAQRREPGASRCYEVSHGG